VHAVPEHAEAGTFGDAQTISAGIVVVFTLLVEMQYPFTPEPPVSVPVVQETLRLPAPGAAEAVMLSGKNGEVASVRPQAEFPVPVL
jgi:hypothetical protein